MCCGETTHSNTMNEPPRVGARVDFFSPRHGCHLGNLLFLNPSTPTSARATHVRYNPTNPTEGVAAVATDENVLVSIQLVHPPFLHHINPGMESKIPPAHSLTGDLTKSVHDSGLLQQFTLPVQPTSSESQWTNMGGSLLLNVGGDGIIGRRVSMTKEGEMLADGIVGFNSAFLSVPASL
ncbi:hypothetical protein B0H66DRAFT_148701 [Apodospora peruviana]|uniref:Uncharacterized protein n=1 Tax=Apodospora peruviana TaxID=516989 RepID=A0AAE0IJ93_9PEZI|nr:hypothetical protein B0H66DRAFT_148701 [Apodospora peruviana]